jgi:ubiquinol-cytochrome c reductase core subunit 2
LESPTTKYYGGEERIAHGKGSSVVIAFPGSSLENGTAYKPEIEVLAALLGGQSSVKWSAGNSLLGKVAAEHTGASIKTDTSKYSDHGLLTVTINGSSKAVAAAAKDVAKTLKSALNGGIAKEDVKKAIAQAKFKVADSTSAVSSTLDLIGLNVITNGKVPSSEEALKGINEVTEEKIKQVRILRNSDIRSRSCRLIGYPGCQGASQVQGNCRFCRRASGTPLCRRIGIGRVNTL